MLVSLSFFPPSVSSNHLFIFTILVCYLTETRNGDTGSHTVNVPNKNSFFGGVDNFSFN
jgi:hypothetical protein